MAFSRIDAELLIPGRGEPIENASLVYSDSKIVYVGTTSSIPQQHENLTPFKVPVLMPGMWDCHVHFGGFNKFSMDAAIQENPVIAGMRIARDSVATLNAGFTSVRELFGYGVQLTKVIGEGWLPGPRIYSAVSLLSQTGGHGDARGLCLHEFWDRVTHGFPAYLCDGPDECIKAVRVQLRKGASLIKIAASGGIATNGDDIQAQQFSDEELKTIVEEAGRQKLIVAAHCHGNVGVQAALRAGCHTIEHGTFLDDETVALMKEKGAMLIATRGVVEAALSIRDAWTPGQYQDLLSVQKHHRQAYEKAIKAGIRCAIGTDAGASAFSFPWNHGMNGREIKFAVEAGLTPLQAIEAATANGPETLGPKAPKSGQLREGYDADFIALSANPLENITILENQSSILHVWKDGKLWKKDGQSISVLDTRTGGIVP